MNGLLIALSAISVIALTLATVSLVLLQAWRKDPPNIRALREEVAAIQGELTDLADRTHHWFRREGVRRAREALPAANGGEAYPQVPLTKAELRARLRASQVSIHQPNIKG